MPAYTPQTWTDGSTGGTPISAARLNVIEAGIASRADAATALTELVDVTVSGTSGQLVLGKTSNVAAGGTYTSPALPASVGTPAARFAIKGNAAGSSTITYPNEAGTSTTVTILAGEVLTLRQKSTSGWGAESGNKPLAQLDALYGSTPAGRALATAADAAAQRTALSVYSKAEAVTQTVTASSATPTPTGSAFMNQLFVTALAAAATIGAPSGTATDGNVLIIRLKDNGTARALTFNAIYRGIGRTLPTTTALSKTTYLAFIYNAADTKWDLVDIAQEA